MSFSIGSLVGFVRIDHSGVRSGMAGAEQEVAAGQRRMGQQADRGGRDIGTRFGKGIHANVKSSFDDVAKSWKRLGAGLLAGAAVGGVVSFFGDAVAGASNLEQSIGGVDAVFGKYAANVHAKSQQAAQDLGLSANAYNELITVSGAMLKNKGLTDFAEQSQKLIGIGADLAAQYGGSTKDAVEALNAAMRGESDPIERYGISLNETAVNAKLAQNGMAGLTGAALEQAKTQARLQIITDQSKDALGAFGRESDTLAGKQQRLAAEWENQKTALGQQLLPVMVNLTDFVSGSLLPAFSGTVDMLVKLGGVIGSIPGPVKGAIAVLVAFHLLKGPVGSMLDTVRLKSMYAGDAIKGMGKSGAGVKGVLSGLVGAINPWTAALTLGVGAIAAWGTALQEAGDRADRMRSSLTELYKTGATAEGRLKAFQSSFNQKQLDDYRSALEGVGIKWSDYLDAIAQGGPALDTMNKRVSQAYDNQGLFHGVMGEVVDVTNQWAETNKTAAVTGKELADAETRATGAAKGAAGAQGDLADKTGTAGGAAGDAAPKVSTYADRMDDLRKASDEAEKKQHDLAAAMLEVIDAAAGSDSAAIDYEKSLDDANERIQKRIDLEKELAKAGGKSDRTKELEADLAKTKDPKKRASLQEQLSKSQAKDAKNTSAEVSRLREELAKYTKGLDINTEAGRENKQSLIDLADRAKGAAEKSLKAGDSVKSVADTMATRRKDFVDMALAFGANRKEAEYLADKYGVTKKTVDELSASLGDVPKDTVATLTAETADANAKVAEAKDNLEGYWTVVNGIPTFVPTTVSTPGLDTSKAKADDYYTVINGIPTRKPTTLELTVSGLADLRTADAILRGLASFGVALDTRGAAKRADLTRRFGGDAPGYATGTLIGPGTGTSDSISAIVAQTGRALRVSAGEFISTDSSRKRNRAALEAGNRGALLEVAGTGGRGGLGSDDVDRIGKTFARHLAAILPGVSLAVGVSDVQHAAMGR